MLLAGVVGVAGIGVAHAAFPDKPITIVMPYGPGSGPDAYARLFAEKLQQRVGVPVVVENRPGASGTIGAAYAARAKHDGYTILYGSTSNISSVEGFFKTLNYAPLKDLEPVTVVAEAYYLFVTPVAESATSMSDYLEKIKKNPEDFPVAGATGAAQVLSNMLRNSTPGLDYTYVSYTSTTNMITDLLGGRLGGLVTPVAGVTQLIKGGKLHGMGVIAPKRLAAIPDVPTVNEALATKNIDLGMWTGYFVPTGTPKDVINTLYEHMTEVLKDPAVIEITELGGSVMHLTPEESAEYIKQDAARWPDLLKAAGIEPT